jgi:hypothetical protein
MNRIAKAVDITMQKNGFKLTAHKTKSDVRGIPGTCVDMEKLLRMKPRKRTAEIRRVLHDIGKISTSDLARLPPTESEIEEFMKNSLVPEFWPAVKVKRFPDFTRVSMEIHFMETTIIELVPTKQDRHLRNRMLYDALCNTFFDNKAMFYMHGIMECDTPMTLYITSMMDRLWDRIYPEEKLSKSLDIILPDVLVQIVLHYIC